MALVRPQPKEGRAINTIESFEETEAGRRLLSVLDRMWGDRQGRAAQRLWDCEDGWIIGYTTTRVQGGPNHDQFVVLAYRPTGRGARSGKPSSWKISYRRGFATRKTAKRRALQLYYRHSPKRAARHGWTGNGYGR